MKFARYVFLIAGIYGILAVAPMYFMETQIGVDFPPPINHPEYFYGFIGVTLAWQVAFIFISTNPVRYRLLMIAAMLEKFSYTAAAVPLFLQGRVSSMVLGFSLVDLMLGILFVVAFVKVREEAAST